MYQITAWEEVDGRQVPTPVLATDSAEIAKRVYCDLGAKLLDGGLHTPISLNVFDPRQPTGWREVLSTRRLLAEG